MRVWLRFLPVVALLPALIAASAPGTRAAAPAWAPASTATIHPGTQTYTNSAQCTANFVFVDGVHVYLGQAAHCSSTGSSSDTNGCVAKSLPVGTQVHIIGAQRPAVMVYNSWVTMQALGEKDPNTCDYNDLALLQLDPVDLGSVNPSVPVWGGPLGLNTAGTAAGDPVYFYGHSSLLLGLGQFSPRQGQSEGDTGNGWSHTVSVLPPGVPGDSGSGFLDQHGNALGVLSTLDVGTGLSNGVGDLSRELAYLHAHSGFTRVRLAPGTEPFRR
jgi:hypothetical protein